MPLFSLLLASLLGGAIVALLKENPGEAQSLREALMLKLDLITYTYQLLYSPLVNPSGFLQSLLLATPSSSPGSPWPWGLGAGSSTSGPRGSSSWGPSPPCWWGSTSRAPGGSSCPWPSSPPPWPGALGGNPGLAQGPLRGPRGDQHHHVQLHRGEPLPLPHLRQRVQVLRKDPVPPLQVPGLRGPELRDPARGPHPPLDRPRGPRRGALLRPAPRPPPGGFGLLPGAEEPGPPGPRRHAPWGLGLRRGGASSRPPGGLRPRPHLGAPERGLPPRPPRPPLLPLLRLPPRGGTSSGPWASPPRRRSTGAWRWGGRWSS